MASLESDIQLPGHHVLRNNNEEISKYLKLLKDQREELMLLIDKQEVEKKYLKTEIERLKYKFKLVTKSLNQRIMTKDRYDQTIVEAETLFKKIVVSSDTLLGAVRKDVGALEETINKKVGTETNKSNTKIARSCSMSQQKAIDMTRTKGSIPIAIDQMQSHLDFAFKMQMGSAEARRMKASPPTSPTHMHLFGLGPIDSFDYI